MKRLLKKLKRKPITRKKSRVYKKSAPKKQLRVKPPSVKPTPKKQLGVKPLKRKKLLRKKSKKSKMLPPKPKPPIDNAMVKERKTIRVCRIMNDHGEIIELPLEYPGDDVVHQDLNPLRHLEITQFDPQYFRDLYNKYRKVCSK